MKHLTLSLIYGLLITLTALNLQADDKLKLSGSIEAPDNDTIILLHDATHLGLSWDADTAILKDGKFELEIPLGEMALVELKYDNYSIPIYAAAGDEMTLNFHADSLQSSAYFEGAQAVENNFLHDFRFEFAPSFEDSVQKEKMSSQLIDVFEIELFNQNKKQSKFFKGHSDKGKMSSAFQDFIKSEIRYNYLYQLFAYPIIRGNRNQTKKTVDELPRVMTEVVKEEWINAEAAMISPAYRNFLNYYVVYKTSELNEFKKFVGHSESVEKKYYYARQILEAEPFNFFLSKWLSEKYQLVKPSSLRFLYGALEDTDIEKKYSPLVKETMGERLNEEDSEEEIAAAAVETEAAPDTKNAMFVDREGKAVSLDDFKGKVVYVDFWASWCGPCRAQMPKSKELHGKLSSKQQKKVVFLYISIDDSKEKWEGAIEKMGIEGNHFWSKGGWGSRVCKLFKINSIPRYMIIDKDGVIVEQNAPRPGSPETLQKILELL